MIELRDYQQRAKDQFFTNNKRGTFLYATGTGKTEVAIGIIKQYLETYPQNKILFLVPRISLVEQTQERLSKYGFNSSMYYSLSKDLTNQIIVSTYQSISKMMDILPQFHFIIFDEVHLASDYAEVYRKIMIEGHKAHKDMLALTATIDKSNYERYGTILTRCPLLSEITLTSAIDNGYLTKVVIEDQSVSLSFEGKTEYDDLSQTIRRISDYFGTSNPRDILAYLKQGDKNAAIYFKAVQRRKLIMEYNEEKINKTVSLIKNFNNEQTIIFTERTATLELLKEKLGDQFEYITAKTGKKKRQEILNNFGKTFSIIGTVHTLDIGYDVPNLRHGIIIASNKNDTTIVQRVGRLVRKSEGKTIAHICVIYAKGTHEVMTFRKIKGLVNNG